MGATAAAGQACTLDGKPTLTVNGWPVVLNQVIPTTGNLQTWAPFVLAYPLHPGRVETLQEDTRRVPLPPDAFTHAWRWRFGDAGAPQYGMAVHHVFRAPGRYRITVDAYAPSSKAWYTFDAALVQVVRLPQD